MVINYKKSFQPKPAIVGDKPKLAGDLVSAFPTIQSNQAIQPKPVNSDNSDNIEAVGANQSVGAKQSTYLKVNQDNKGQSTYSTIQQVAIGQDKSDLDNQEQPTEKTEIFPRTIQALSNSAARRRDGRRLPDNSPRNYEITELRERHKRMVELSFLGYSHRAIARMLGVTSQNVSDVLNSEVAKEQLGLMSAEREAETVSIAKQIRELAPEALRAMKLGLVRETELMVVDNTKPMTKMALELSKEILNRSGYAPKVETRNTHLHLTAEDLRGLKDEALGESNRVEYQEAEAV